MSETTAPPKPRAIAFSLVRTTALDEAARHAPAASDRPPTNWAMYRSLTAALENWQEGGTLRKSSLLLAEWLAVDLVAYLFQQLGSQARLERWLHDFGDEVCQVQQHEHPAGPTAMAIMSVVADDLTVHASKPTGAQRLARMAVPYLLYLRDNHEVEDAREVALTFAMWAGAQLAALMHHDAERIIAYADIRGDAQ